MTSDPIFALIEVHRTALAAANDAPGDDLDFSIGREVEELLRIRREADEAAFRLIALLDLDQPDPDLEDGGDHEQTLGWTASEAAYGRTKNTYANTDGEFELDLGWTSGLNQGGRNWHGRPHSGSVWTTVPDGEDEHDGREPSLGSVASHECASQEGWAAGDPRDLEEQCEDEGASDIRLRARRKGRRATP
jgi:hypothetical protein